MATENITSVEKVVFVSSLRAVATIFRETIGDHPMAAQLEADIEKCWTAFRDLYNKAVDVYHRSLTVGNAVTPYPRFWAVPEKGVYVPGPRDEPVVIGEGHYYEMMDRTGCMNQSFDSLIVKHSVAQLFKQEIDTLSDLLADLYQKAATLNHDYLEQKNGN